MVVCLRVDERMIHGQIVATWIRLLNCTNLIVANDRAANNDIESMSLKMAIPDGIKGAVVSIDRAIAILNDPRSEKLRIMVIAEKPLDGKKIAQAVKGIKEINVANYGALINPDEEGKIVLAGAGTLRVTKEEIEEIREMVKTGVPVYHQTIPSHQKEDLSKV